MCEKPQAGEPLINRTVNLGSFSDLLFFAKATRELYISRSSTMSCSNVISKYICFPTLANVLHDSQSCSNDHSEKRSWSLATASCLFHIAFPYKRHSFASCVLTVNGTFESSNRISGCPIWKCCTLQWRN
jgi:hypothetical protein